MNEGVLFQSIRSGKAPHKIAQAIREHILHGRLKTGDKLPPEHVLLESFAVSRQTLREGLRILEMQGFLQIRAGAKGGTFVAEVDMDITQNSLINFLHHKNLSIAHLSAVRLLLEPYFAAVAAESMTDEEIAQLGSLLDEAKTLLVQGNTDALRKNEIQFHRMLAQVSKNPLLILLQDFIENLLKDAKSILRPDETFSQHVMEMHEKIFHAIQRRDAEAASKFITEDITMVEESLQKLAEKHDPITWS